MKGLGAMRNIAARISAVASMSILVTPFLFSDALSIFHRKTPLQQPRPLLLDSIMNINNRSNRAIYVARVDYTPAVPSAFAVVPMDRARVSGWYLVNPGRSYAINLGKIPAGGQKIGYFAIQSGGNYLNFTGGSRNFCVVNRGFSLQQRRSHLDRQAPQDVHDVYLDGRPVHARQYNKTILSCSDIGGHMARFYRFSMIHRQFNSEINIR